MPPGRSRLVESRFLVVIVLAAIACSRSAARSAEPLASWNDGPTKRAILDFTARVTTPGSPDFIPVAERIATFDNDGTLWPEGPTIQVAFVQSQLKALAAKDPAMKQRQPFKALLEGDEAYLVEAGESAIMEIVAVTSANMTDQQYSNDARKFFETARHPRFDVPYTALAYRPMVELLAYLREQGFTTFICSGGGADFMRLVSEQMYGIPPEQVIGSSLKKEFKRDGKRSWLWRKPAVFTISDKEGKPINIDVHIGKRPVFAAGNVRTGGDIAMLEYSQEPGRRSLQLMVNHDDPVREFAYSEKNGASLAAARANGWHVVSIKDDWRTVFAPR